MSYNNNRRNMKFNSSWTVYIHDSNDRNWCLESYKKVWVIQDELTFWQFFNSISDFTTHNFYFMKNSIQPTHEYHLNKNGTDLCYNIRKNMNTDDADTIHQRRMKDYIITMVARLVTGDLCYTQHEMNTVNGLEVIQKEHKSIMKIWLSDKNNVPHITHVIDNKSPFLKSRRGETKYGSRKVHNVVKYNRRRM